MMELSFAYHLYQFDTCQQSLCPLKGFESQRGSHSTLDTLVLLLDKVVKYLLYLTVIVSSSGLSVLAPLLSRVNS